MDQPSKLQAISYIAETNQKCSVPNCGNEAVYTTALVDYYDDGAGERWFYQQDYTCPFLCEDHKQENEEKHEGEPTPRRINSYPFTNKHGAQGWTEYLPVSEAKR